MIMICKLLITGRASHGESPSHQAMPRLCDGFEMVTGWMEPDDHHDFDHDAVDSE